MAARERRPMITRLNAVAICGGLLVASASLAKEALPPLAERADVESSLVSLLVDGYAYLPLSEAAKTLPASKRAAAVKVLGRLVKEIAGSSAFATRYESERTRALPPPPALAKDGATLAAEQKAETDKNLSDAEKAIDSAPKEMQATLRQQLAAARKEMAANAPAISPEDLARGDAERFAREKEAYDKAVREHPAKVSEAIQLRLQHLLSLTDNVDYSAATIDEDGRRRFADAAKEERPQEWKMCFRAGREACEAARSFAREWLAELGK